MGKDDEWESGALRIFENMEEKRFDTSVGRAFCVSWKNRSHNHWFKCDQLEKVEKTEGFWNLLNTCKVYVFISFWCKWGSCADDEWVEDDEEIKEERGYELDRMKAGGVERVNCWKKGMGFLRNEERICEPLGIWTHQAKCCGEGKGWVKVSLIK